MPVAKKEPQPRGDEQVYGWRMQTLTEAGYPIHLAEKLAGEPTIDLHHAVDMLAQGCSVATAMEILL